ncbi:LysR family transcriptional regulator [Asaia sp. VD9]|uniref:LysR family transcriptional regulator n=1 Tax=Asaia sp. VD9 TaxID=3081235 RepID=UPI003016070F
MDYLQAMRYFVTVAESGSFSRAAAHHHVEVSTISRHIVALERDLRAALFNRSTRMIHLTEAGHLFHERAQHLLEDMSETITVVREHNARPQGVLRIGVSPLLGRRSLLTALTPFLHRHKKITLDLTLTEETADPIGGGYDATLHVGGLPESSLILCQLGPLAYRLVCAPSILTNEKHLLGVNDLARSACLATTENPDWRAIPREGRVPPSLPPLRPRLCSRDVDTLYEAALAGAGTALLPEIIVREALASGMLVPVLEQYHWCPGETDPSIALLYAPKKVVSAKLRAFIETMQAWSAQI